MLSVRRLHALAALLLLYVGVASGEWRFLCGRGVGCSWTDVNCGMEARVVVANGIYRDISMLTTASSPQHTSSASRSDSAPYDTFHRHSPSLPSPQAPSPSCAPSSTAGTARAPTLRLLSLDTLRLRRNIPSTPETQRRPHPPHCTYQLSHSSWGWLYIDSHGALDARERARLLGRSHRPALDCGPFETRRSPSDSSHRLRTGLGTYHCTRPWRL